VPAIRYHLLISGRVQGVFFRDSMRGVAQQHGVAGWVRNLPDGRVEAVVEGPEAEVGQVLDWARHGPRRAVVDDVSMQAEPPGGLTGFIVR
jgi:acylphosphatase